MYLRGYIMRNLQDQAPCLQVGGTPVTVDPCQGYSPFTCTAKPYYDCFKDTPAAVAASGSPANISVSVPTNVNTQISPQISPSFVQQDQPSNSPVSTAASANPSQSTAQADIADYLQQYEKAAAQREARLLDALNAGGVSTPQATYLAPPAPAEAGAMPFPDYVQKNIVPLAVAAAALISIAAYLKSKRK